MHMGAKRRECAFQRVPSTTLWSNVPYPVPEQSGALLCTRRNHGQVEFADEIMGQVAALLVLHATACASLCLHILAYKKRVLSIICLSPLSVVVRRTLLKASLALPHFNSRIDHTLSDNCWTRRTFSYHRDSNSVSLVMTNCKPALTVVASGVIDCVCNSLNS